MHAAKIDLETARPLAEFGGGTSKRARRAVFYAGTLVVDVAALSAGFALPVLFGLDFDANQTTLTLIAALIALYVGLTARSISPDIIRDWRKGVAPAATALCTATAIAIIVAFVVKESATISRLHLATGVAAGLALLIVTRWLDAFAARSLFSGHPIATLLITDGADAEAADGADKHQAHGLGLGGDLSNPLILDRVARAVSPFDRVVVVCRPNRRGAWATALRASSVRADMIVPELDDIQALGCDRLGSAPLVPITGGRMSVRDEVLKRLVDVSIASAALLFFSPLMIATAVAVKLETKGPILFRQERVGRGNRLFQVLKFRSMRTVDCDSAGGVSTARDDRRITRVGRIIRATSIDELPQLINVLRGEMSIVGPRPHALGSLAGNQLFWEIDRNYHHRHACRPGLTGLAQVRGFRGATERPEDLINRLQADLEYLHGWSIWRDFEIMIATTRVVIHRNAY